MRTTQKTPRKSRRSRSSRRARPDARQVDVVSQLECALRRPSAALLGGVLGGFVPWFARELAHGELPSAWRAGDHLASGILVAVVLGCCLFSMVSVYLFGRAAFGDSRKAAGFVLALEGVMLVSQGRTSLVALAVLVAINAVANGCVIATARDATLRRREADARRSSTRAQNRAARTPAPPAPPATASEPSPAAPPVTTWARRDDWSDAQDADLVDEGRLLS